MKHGSKRYPQAWHDKEPQAQRATPRSARWRGWQTILLFLLLVGSSHADQNIRWCANRTDNGYPYLGAPDTYAATISVQEGVQTHLPAGSYSVPVYNYRLGPNGWAWDGIYASVVNYTVGADGTVTGSDYVQRGVGWSDAEWLGAVGSGNFDHVQFRAFFTDASGQTRYKVLTLLTQGPQVIVGQPDWSALPLVLAALQNKTEDLKADPSQGCSCNCQAGTCDAGLGSIDFSVKLGHSNFGEDQGTLTIHTDTPTLDLSTPKTLLDKIEDPACMPVYQNSVLRQVLAAQCLLDVQPVNSFKYQINFYQRTAGDPQDGNGLYLCGGAPFKTITVENSDASPIVYNRLRITEAGPNSPNRVSEYDWDAAGQRWDLLTNGGLRKESLATLVDAATGDKIETRSIFGSVGQTVAKKVQRFHAYSWGNAMIGETLDPDGAALTSTWTYYENGDPSPGAFAGKLKQRVDASGRWDQYQYANGLEAKHVSAYLDAPLGSPDNQCRVVTITYAASNPVKTVVQTIQGVETGRSYVAVTPDGQTQNIVCPQPGAAWNDPGNLVTTSRYNGSGDLLREQRPDGTLTTGSYTVSGNQKQSVVAVGAPSTDGSTVVDGTVTTTLIDAGGNQLMQTVVDVAGSLTLSSSSTVQTDLFGRPTRVVYADGTSETTSYGCCGLNSNTDRDGNTTSYVYDALSRMISRTQAGVTTLYTYDAVGNRLTTARQGSDGSTITVEQLAYDLAGRRISRTDALGNRSTYGEALDPATGHTVRTTTLSDDAHSTQIQKYFQDGSPLGVEGTGAHPLSYGYGVDAATGAWTQEIRVGSQGQTSEWTRTYTDAAGRPYRTETAAGAVTQSFFNAQGQLSRSVDSDGVTMLYGYNARGEQDTVTLDLDQNGQIDLAGTDRITRTVHAVIQAHSATVIQTTTSAWTTNGTDASVVLAVDEQNVNGRESWHTDAGGLVTHALTSCDGAGTCTTTVTAPDGSSTVGVTQAGRAISQTRYDANAQVLGGTTMDYDPQGRLWHQTDLRNGPTTYVYDHADQLRSVSHAGQTTGYDYDALGRKKLQTEPDNGQIQTRYWPTGEVKSLNGVRTYPQEYTYDSRGRLKTLTTHGAAGAATTTWNYDGQSGQMVGKVYADGKGPSYTYTPGGRLLTRTWARGIVTTYGYDNAGQLQAVIYSDGTTPAGGYAYDRLGRLVSASGGGSARTLAYQGNTNLLASETATAGPLTGVTVGTGYDGLLRRTSLSVANNGTNLLTQGFGFDAASRLANAGQGTASAAYTYWPNSAANLVQSMAFKNNGQPVLTTAKTYDAFDRLGSIVSTVNGAATPVAGYGYGYNAANERVRADVAADGSHWLYGYDGLGQVTAASRQWADNSPVGGQQYGYAFDAIGNRTSTTVNGRPSAYASNLLNEYGQRTVPGAVDVLGTAAPDATVTLNGRPTVRQSGGYFYGTASADNVQAAADVPVNVAAVRQGTGTSANALGVQQGAVFLPRTPEQLGYDADGNLTQDGHWTYAWDGENRLVGMEALGSLPSAERRELAFGYDDTGRRIQKQVWAWNAATSAYQVGANTRFAYDGWNLAAELDGANNGALLRGYLW